MSASTTPRLPTDERREQILAATLRVLAHTSLDGLSTRRLAAELGVTQPALFRHFASREELLLAAVTSARVDLGRLASAALEVRCDPRARLRALGHALLDHVEAHPGLPRLLFAMGTPSSGPVRDAIGAVVSMQATLVAELVRESQRNGSSAPQVDAEVAATLFVGMMQGLVLRWEFAGRCAGLSARLDAPFAIWWRGIGGASETPREHGAAEPAHGGAAKGPAAEVSDEEVTREPLRTLDARPLLAKGVDPLGHILAALRNVASRGVLVVVAPFRPTPLLTLLTGRGHGVHVEEAAPGQWIVEVVVDGGVGVEDLRDHEPPEPLARVLTAAEALPPGGVYLARLPRYPAMLVPRLRERGHSFAIVERADGAAIVRVERAP